MSEKQYSGSMSTIDGERIQLSPDEAKAIWDACEKASEERKVSMPDTGKALAALSNANQRLQELGWSQGIYCPKNGSTFALIEYGSTGIFRGHYEGKWPNGWVQYCGCSGRPEGMRWKALDKLTEAERKHLAECDEMERKLMERDAQMFGEP